VKTTNVRPRLGGLIGIHSGGKMRALNPVCTAKVNEEKCRAEELKLLRDRRG
jgi:hypothetical protein